MARQAPAMNRTMNSTLIDHVGRGGAVSERAPSRRLSEVTAQAQDQLAAPSMLGFEHIAG